MNTNNDNTPNTDAISAQRRDAMHCVSTNNNVSTATPQHAATTSAVKRGLLQGMAIALGFFGTTVFAVAVSGTIKTWTSGEVLKSADLNTTISSMKTAMESIPNWTKASNGTDAYYTDGKVGIGTASPASKLHINASTFSGPAMRLYVAGGGHNYLEMFTGVDGNVAWSFNDNAGNRNFAIYRYNSSGIYVDGPFQISNSTGAVTIPGALSKGSGTFDIAHPDPSMPKNSRLRHSFVESPTAGDNIYRWQIKVTRENGKFFIRLPKYWTHLNTNPMVWVSSADQSAASFGYVDMKQEKVIVQADRTGTYNVLLLGTRKDSLAANNWKELGMEYISKGIGEAGKILSYNAQPEFGEEPQEQTSLRTL